MPALMSMQTATRAEGDPVLVARSLRVGSTTDPMEAQADEIADRVMRMPAPDPSLVRRCPGGCPDEEALRRQPLDEEEGTEGEEDEEIQAKARTEAGRVDTPAAAEIGAKRGGGMALPASTRGFFEPRFGADFGSVRVHHDAAAGHLAQRVNARAFTLGSDVFFGAGEYSPATSSGQRLLAHELAHTVQQSGDPLGTRVPSIKQEFIRRQAGQNEPDPSCRGYDRGERRRSRSKPGLLTDDVSVDTPGNLLVADFPVNSSKLGRSAKENPLLQSWLQTFESDDSYKLSITGYSDCVGRRDSNSDLRHGRAQTVRGLLGPKASSRLGFVGMRGLGEYVASNHTASDRARNRSAVIDFGQRFDFPAERIVVRRPPHPLRGVWVGVGETQSGDIFLVGKHSSVVVVYNLGDSWPNVRYALVTVSGYKFGPGLGGSAGAAFVLVTGVSRASEFSDLTPGGFDFDLALGAKLKGWLSSVRGVKKIITTLDEYKKLSYVGQQAVKNKDLAKKGLHSFAIPLAGGGLHAWAGYQFGEVELITHGRLGK